MRTARLVLFSRFGDHSQQLEKCGTLNSEDEKRPTKMEIFTLSKALSIEEASWIPHPRDEKNQYDHFTQHLIEITEKKNCEKPLEFYSPLLVKYAFSLSENVLDRSFAW